MTRGEGRRRVCRASGASARGTALILLLSLPAPVSQAPEAPEVPRSVRMRGDGPLSLRLEGIDLEDVFAVLHRETGQAFVVADDVGGRVSVDLVEVTLEEALSALGSLGLSVASRGAVRIVRAEPIRAASGTPAVSGTLEPLSMSLKRWPIETLAGLLGEIENRSVSVPEGRLGHASVFAEDVPRDVLFAAILDAAGLFYRIESERTIIQRRDTAPGAQRRRLPQWHDPETPQSIADTPVAALRLVGLVGSGREWTAWVYTQDRRVCWPLSAGQRLQDGEIARIEADHVLFEGERGGSFVEEPKRFRARLALPVKNPERR